MSRYHGGTVIALEVNRNSEYPEVPSMGTWELAYGKDHTAVGYFIQWFPVDAEAIKMTGNVDTPIDLDQCFSKHLLTAQAWCEILESFGIKDLR